MPYRLLSILLCIMYLTPHTVLGNECTISTTDINALLDSKITKNASPTYIHKSLSPPDSVATPLCAPAIPSNGDNFWNVLVYSGTNTYSDANFKGYYQAISGHQPATIPGSGTTPDSYTFKFNPSLDGWSALQSPADALASKGAKTDYVGCAVSPDGFSIRAKRKGFPCGFYGSISVRNLQKPDPPRINIKDGFSLRVDTDGDGITDMGGNLTCQGCEDAFLSLGVFLGPNSIIEFDTYNSTDSFNIEILFNYVIPKTVAWAEQSTICKGNSTIINIGGSENYTWTPALPLLNPNTFGDKRVVAIPSVSTNYRATSDIAGCRDTVFVPITVIPLDTVRRDSVSCSISTASTLTYNYKNINGCDSTIIVTVKPTRKDTVLLPILSRCNPIDTVTKVLTLKNVGGCDSLVIQRYKLSSADTVLRDSFICNSLNVNTLTYRYKNISGCDSVNIVTLKLLKKDTTVLPILSRCNPSDTVTKVLN